MPEFVQVIVSLICLMLANILIGTKLADLKQEFNKEKLVSGISKAVFTLIGLALIYASTIVFPMEVTTLTGTTILLKGANLIYAGKVLLKIKDIFMLNIPVEVLSKDEEENNEPKEEQLRLDI